MLAAQTEIIKAVLKKVREFRPIGKMGTEVCSLLQIMNEDYDKFDPFFSSVFSKFVGNLSQVKFCMPSSLLSNVQRVMEETTSDENF